MKNYLSDYDNNLHYSKKWLALIYEIKYYLRYRKQNQKMYEWHWNFQNKMDKFDYDYLLYNRK